MLVDGKTLAKITFKSFWLSICCIKEEMVARGMSIGNMFKIVARTGDKTFFERYLM